MLTVAKIAGSGAAAYGQYLEGRTQAAEAGDYYLAAAGERVEAPGRWVLGEQGTAALGVDAGQAVAAEQFQAVMAVQNPSTGEQLRSVGAGGAAVAAIDATFSAPKSVSAVWALGSPELRAGIEAAQERAVDAALAHAVEHVPMVRRRVDRATVLREKPAELIASSWRHTTARAVAGSPPDPQLHSHVVLHGAVRGDGRVVAIESRAWLVHQREVGAAYRAQLAVELAGLGFGVVRGTGRGGRYFELAGVPGGLLEEWSARHHQVREAIEQRLSERLGELRAQAGAGGPGAAVAVERLGALERSGQLMPAEQRAIAMATRAGKGELATSGDLDRAWWAAASGHGFDVRSVERLRERGPSRELGEGELERVILARLTEFDATFAPREARAVALEAVAGGDPARALAALGRLAERREILDLADGRQTTRAHRGVERAALAAAGALAGGEAQAIAVELVDQEVAALGAQLGARGAQLAGEQEQAIRAACSDRRLVVIVGQAGTGKSTALTGVARAQQAAGRELIVTSTGAQAAERLAGELAEAGVRTVGYSTRALEAAVERGAVALGPNVTIVHDEAALASTREQAWLLDAAVRSGARVIEVGDPRQSQAVGAGGLWPAVERAARERGALVELQRIVRARDQADRRDQRLWRAGEHERALAGYEARGRVVVEERQQRAEDRALEAAHADRQAGKSSLVVVQASNEQLDALNARAQALRVQDGELGRDGVALRGRPYELRAGDELVFRAASRHSELGAVRNGARGRVLDVAAGGQSAVVRLANGREASWERSQLDAGSARLSYVQHSWPAQGQTVDRCHVIAGEHADANGSYVALTRAREQTHLYASTERLAEHAGAGEDADGRETQLASLARQLGRSEPELASISIPLAYERQVERDATAESDTSTPEPAAVASAEALSGSAREATGRDQLDRVRVERDQARAGLEQARVTRAETAAVLAGEPRDRHAELARANAERRVQDARLARTRGEPLAGELGELGRLVRLGERGRALKAQIAAVSKHERDALAEQRSFCEEADTREAALGEQHRAWDARHPGAHERHHAAEAAHELAEARHQQAERLYGATQAHELARQSFPIPPTPDPAWRLQQLQQEHARLQALGERADQARLAQVQAELEPLKRAVKPDGTELLRRRRPGASTGPTIGR